MPVSLIRGEGAEDLLCLYHFKVVNGLIDPRDLAIGHGSIGIRRSDIVSSEMAEISEVLEKLGAPSWVVKQALTKRLRIGDTGRKGRGVKDGRVGIA